MADDQHDDYDDYEGEEDVDVSVDDEQSIDEESGQKAKVLFQFEAKCDVELDLEQNEIITVYRTDVGEGWWEGEKNGVRGLFPGGYVELLRDGESGEEPTPVQTTQVAAPPNTSDKRYKILSGPKWAGAGSPITITMTANQKKGSKFSGMKQFTTYEISCSNNNLNVIRRFKHFTWLYSRLVESFPCVCIPPIPEKQIQGRFEQRFIEERRKRLELFLNRVAQHPVLGSSSVFFHFLTTTDQKEWKTGKRKAEAAGHTSSFLSNIDIPDGLPQNAEVVTELFSKFIGWLEKQISSLNKGFTDLLAHQEGAADEFMKISVALKGFGEITDARIEYTEWWSDEDSLSMEGLLAGLHGLADSIGSVGQLANSNQEIDRAVIVTSLKEYLTTIRSLRNIIKAHDAAQQARANPQQDSDQRALIVINVALAEFRHFHENFVSTVKAMISRYIETQVRFHQQAITKWEAIGAGFNSL